MYNHTSIINSKCRISIGEPWDFCSSAGDNVLTGHIRMICEQDDWLLCEVSPFQSQTATVGFVVVTSRYSGQLVAKEVLSGKIDGANIYFSPGRVFSNPDEVSSFLKTDARSFLIGSVFVD